METSTNGPIPGLPPSVSSKLSKDGADWITSVIDPFHDFSRSIEGAPDINSGRSYTRRYEQTATISAVADDDNIAVDFYGFHGVATNFQVLSNIGTVPYPGSHHSISPVTVIRCPSTSHCTVGDLISGTGSRLAAFNTVHNPEIPSRLISLGLEIVDMTPSLYRKGAMFAVHGNGNVTEGCAMMECDTSGYISSCVFPVVQTTTLPIYPTQMTQSGNAYVGKASQGIYTQARFREFKDPELIRYTNASGVALANGNPLPIISYASGTAPRVNRYISTADTAPNLITDSKFRESGFEPFRVFMSGLPEQGSYQITVKCVVEYFPDPTHLFEYGLASPSPAYDPNAVVMYHDAIRSLPPAVPVSYNAAGDWWKMVRRTMTGVAKQMVRYSPVVLDLLGGAATAGGIPEAGVAASVLANMVRAVPKQKVKKTARKTQVKKPIKLKGISKKLR